MVSEQKASLPLKFSIYGYEERLNDVLYCSPIVHSAHSQVVVYFGGDIQDFKENMESHRDNKNYLNWSLENTAKILQSAFSNSHIILIRPIKMEYKTFSCFENFVPCGNCGVPEHIPMHHSLEHLEKILANLSTKLTANELLQTETFSSLSDCSMKIIGFSKGCVVLNQFLHEFHHIQTNNERIGILPKIEAMYWLDGGHSGGKNTWVTQRPLLETFSLLGINVYIHVSPYQIKDERRPWIRKEEKIFYNTLSSLGVSVQRRAHHEDAPPDILHHFGILKEFRQNH